MKCGSDKVSQAQRKMHEALARFGIPTLIADEDFHRKVRTKGAAMLTPTDLYSCRTRVYKLERQLKELLEALANEKAAIDNTPVLFGEPSEELKQLMDKGLLFDARPESVQGAIERQECRTVGDILREQAARESASKAAREAASKAATE